MIGRRGFIKKTAVTGIAFGLCNPLLSSAMNATNNNILKAKYTGFAWDKTIFCQFDDQELNKKNPVSRS